MLGLEERERGKNTPLAFIEMTLSQKKKSDCQDVGHTS
jgi:hypothetical protein